MHQWDPATLERVLFNEVLPLVSKPNRYVGNELGLADKGWDDVRVRFLLCYPDAYEVGMSHTGTQILYHIVNRDPRWLLDRVYAPWPDLEALLRERGIPLWGLQHKRPAREFDVLGFTLQSELTYTNLLNVIELGQIPMRTEHRGEGDPIVMVGGPCASNPEPLAPFVDCALIGDAEDALPELLEFVGEWKVAGRPGGRVGLLRRLAVDVPGAYVPCLYEPVGGRATVQPKADAPAGTPFPVVARKVPVLRSDDHPREMVVSLTETTHDRLPIEVMRGCMRGCRFCQAGYLYRPAREREVEETVGIAQTGIEHSGWQEVSLLSLSTADYSQAVELTDRMSRTMVDRGVGVSLPSLRADAFSVGLAEAVSRVRKSGFTFAPEAGSQRLRDVINKGISETDILTAVERAMAGGWTSVKLYFMIGHPTECEDDFEELAQLVEKIKRILARYPGRRHITLGFSPFVPKAHTPFQWERQSSIEETRTKLAWVKRRLKGRGVEIRHHESADTAIEGIISRGGRETADIIEGAWQRGARFDGWSECCDFGAWQASLAAHGFSLRHVFRERGEDEDLPWEVVSYKIDRNYFLKERRKAYRAAETDECKHERCSACGVCDFEALRNLLALPAQGAALERPAGLLQQVPGTRVRIGYRKRARLRFTSHLDVLRELERTLRRARVPVLYSQGYSPRPRLSAGPPLALGWTSASEWIDLELAGTWPDERLDNLLEDLNEHAVPGLEFFAAGVMPHGARSLAADIARSAYRVRLPNPPFTADLGSLMQGAAEFLAAESVVIRRERRGRRRDVDIRPLVHELAVVGDDELVVQLSTAGAQSVKPTEVVQAMLGMDEARLPLIHIHKFAATLASGEHPLAAAVAGTGVSSFEARDFNFSQQSAGGASRHSGGRSPC